ncbi:CAP domain-containing protein [Anabaena sp. CCY 0017]|uniref:CAP domain-containing protein n=1 Tax=Anabaena sp. CCY 0017 TaxID=3103866 RepID=UPI0039C612EF
MKNQLSQTLWVLGAAMTVVLTGCERVVEYLPPLPKVEIPSRQPPQPPQPTQSATTKQMEIAVRQRINEVRQEKELQTLEHNEKLAEVARNYSRQMAENNFFSHTGNDGSTLQDRVGAGGIIYWVVGENLFKSTNVPQPVKVAVDGWMESPGHRENILRPVFTETGVGVWRVNNTFYITQLFLRR